MEQSSGHHPNLELANTLFPPPPDFYRAFTEANLSSYAQLLGEPSSTNKGKAGPKSVASLESIQGDTEDVSRIAVTPDDAAELEELRSQLTRPRADWVQEEGQWLCFGQRYSASCSLETYPPCLIVTDIVGYPHCAGDWSTAPHRRERITPFIPPAAPSLLPPHAPPSPRRPHQYGRETWRTRRAGLVTRGGPVHPASHQSGRDDGGFR